MSELASLGYVGDARDRLDDWAAFAGGLVGMPVAERHAGGMAPRMDDRRQPFLIDRDAEGDRGEGCRFFGWEVADAADITVTRASRDLPFECDYGPSLWSHERSWLGPEKREEARRLRLTTAAKGYREPVYVLPGNQVVRR